MTFVLQCTEPQTLRRTFENIGHGLELESSRTGEATSGRNRGAAVEVGAAVEADAIGEQQLKRTQFQAHLNLLDMTTTIKTTSRATH